MNKILTLCLIAITIVTITSCDKANNEKTDKLLFSNGGFPGSWEIRELIGCQIPNCDPYFEKGNGTGWSFTDTSYSYYRDHKLAASGQLEKGRDTAPATGQEMDYFIMKNNINNMYSLDKIFYEIKSDTLYLYRGIVAADGTIEKYVAAESDF